MYIGWRYCMKLKNILKRYRVQVHRVVRLGWIIHCEMTHCFIPWIGGSHHRVFKNYYEKNDKKNNNLSEEVGIICLIKQFLLQKFSKHQVSVCFR